MSTYTALEGVLEGLCGRPLPPPVKAPLPPEGAKDHWIDMGFSSFHTKKIGK